MGFAEKWSKHFSPHQDGVMSDDDLASTTDLNIEIDAHGKHSSLQPSCALFHAHRVSSPPCRMHMEYCCCWCCCIAHIIVCNPVIANVEQWLELSIGGQIL